MSEDARQDAAAKEETRLQLIWGPLDGLSATPTADPPARIVQRTNEPGGRDRFAVYTLRASGRRRWYQFAGWYTPPPENAP